MQLSVLLGQPKGARRTACRQAQAAVAEHYGAGHIGMIGSILFAGIEHM